jgi:dolichyl-phosphate-mannose--protein O-mannosyl transferase
VVCSFLFAGWLLNLMPYMAVERSSFIYHYMPGLLYGELLTALFIDKFAGRWVMCSVCLCPRRCV